MWLGLASQLSSVTDDKFGHRCFRNLSYFRVLVYVLTSALVSPRGPRVPLTTSPVTAHNARGEGDRLSPVGATPVGTHLRIAQVPTTFPRPFATDTGGSSAPSTLCESCEKRSVFLIYWSAMCAIDLDFELRFSAIFFLRLDLASRACSGVGTERPQ